MAKQNNQRLKRTAHHNIPTSIGGSDDPVNLVQDLGTEHERYHEWGMNRAPCFNIRLAAINSIGSADCLSPASLRSILEITTMQRWQQLYMAGALRSVACPGAVERAIRSSDFQLTHWKEEELLIRKELHALLNGAHYPVHNETRMLHINVIQTVKTKQGTLQQALRALLTERTPGRAKKRGQYKWVNPMKPESRHALIEAVKTGTAVPTREHRNDFERILEKQLQKVQQYIMAKQTEHAKMQEQWVTRLRAIGTMDAN
ncbi:MAG: hypothetical protein WCX29_03385 [Candidatus Peribacteraceae bacterium]